MTAPNGYITRSNLPSPLTNLDILVDPYWALVGDTQEAADMSMTPGIAPAQSAIKTVWATSPYVAGKQLVLATPDNSTLDLRLLVNGATMVDAQTKLGDIIQAIRDQLVYTVSVTLTGARYTWSCYTGTYLVAYNQLMLFDSLIPIYLTLPRLPVPVAGPV